MRCTLPIRKAAQAIAKAVDFADPEDVNFLFYSELRDVANGKKARASFDLLIAERKAYFNQWNTRIEDMPIVLGTPPETIADPVVIEIFGITDEFLARMKHGPTNAEELSGVPASPGVARGTARVLRSPDELHLLRQGEILVCVGTTPTWMLGLHEDFSLRLRRWRHAYSRLGGQPRIPCAMRCRYRTRDDHDQRRRRNHGRRQQGTGDGTSGGLSRDR